MKNKKTFKKEEEEIIRTQISLRMNITYLSISADNFLKKLQNCLG
jgi:hypothetical protein